MGAGSALRGATDDDVERAFAKGAVFAPIFYDRRALRRQPIFAGC
jgi:hypothetical protein